MSGSNSAQSAIDLKSQIENSLQKEQLTGVIVNVTDDLVELSGTVRNGKEKQTARRIAQSFAGNRKLVDHITVTGEGRGASASPNSETQPMNENAPGIRSGQRNPNNPTNPSPNPIPPHR